MLNDRAVPRRFKDALDRVAGLARFEVYTGAFVFGSVAQGNATDRSDLDVRIVVSRDSRGVNINHPVVDGVKLDMTFNTLRDIEDEISYARDRGERPPMIARSMIVFDKTGDLAALVERADRVARKPLDLRARNALQFMCYHLNDKIERNLVHDPATALYAMHVGINDLLQFHYQIQGRWGLSSKRLLPDLRSRDPDLARLVADFVSTSDVRVKFAQWSTILDYVLRPLGGRLPIAENNCVCDLCRSDLARFWVSLEGG